MQKLHRCFELKSLVALFYIVFVDNNVNLRKRKTNFDLLFWLQILPPLIDHVVNP